MQNSENEKIQVINGKERFDKVLGEIETLLDCGFKVPPFGAVVSAKEIKSQLVTLKKAVQEAVEEAEHIMNIKEQIIKEARNEAEEILRRKQVEIAKQPVIKEAENYAKQLLIEAKKETEKMKREAEEFQKAVKEKIVQFSNNVFDEVDKGLHENRKKVSRNRQDLKMMLDGGSFEEKHTSEETFEQEEYTKQRQLL